MPTNIKQCRWFPSRPLFYLVRDCSVHNFNLSYHMQVKVEEEEFVTGSIFYPNKRKISITPMTKLQFAPRINSQTMAPVLETVVSKNIFFNPTTYACQIIVQVLKPNYFLKEAIIEVQSGNGVLNRLVPCIKCMEIAC